MLTIEDAKLLEQQEKYFEAEKIFRSLLKNDSENGHAYWGLGRLALKANQPKLAISYLHNACSLLPKETFPLLQLAQAFNQVSAEQDALTVLQYAADIAPDLAHIHYQIGQQQLMLGLLVSAVKSFEKTLNLKHQTDNQLLSAYAFLEISKLKKIHFEDPLCAYFHQRLATTSSTDEEQIVIRYGLAKALHNDGEFDAAWQHYQQANQLQLNRCTFKTKELESFFTRIKQVSTKQVLSRQRQRIETELTPIFILGLPRTGSTLLEFILAKHPAIAGAGELPYIGREVANFLTSQTHSHYPEFLSELGTAEMDQAAQLYLTLLAKHAKDKKFVIDKLPANFQSIGLIYKIFPKAKVIHLSRALPATTLSVFTNYFAEDEPYFCSLDEFKKYAQLHADLMGHWHQHLPEFVHEISYESLLDNPKQSVEAILKFCGLAWSDACLDASTSAIPVKTLSNVQVRQPITKAPTSAWKHYQHHLGIFTD